MHISQTPNIVIYSTPTCSYCVIAKQYLTSKHIPFTDYNVAIDHSRATEMMGKSGQMGVPVLDINGQIIIGFDPARIDRALETSSSA